MRGRFHNGEDKWMRINQIMRDRKIGILALQETHLSPVDVDDVHKLFEKRLQVYATIDPLAPTAKGVAIVINKEISNIIGIESKMIIQGRALHLTIPWHGDERLTVLAYYASTDQAENARDLKTLEEKSRNLPKPDVVLGDWNMVEDAIDRLPHNKDRGPVVEAMKDLKRKLKLVDGWRQTYPDTKAYTYLQPGGTSQSRIDRILVTSKIFQNSTDWMIESPGFHTDHQLVSMKYSDPRLPFIGTGHWVMSLFLLKDKIMDKVLAIGKECEDHIESIKNRRTHDDNPQLIFKSFKDETTTLFRERAKIAVPKMDKEISEMKIELKKTLNDPRKGEEERKTEGAAMQE
ncbi:Endonuclease/exonuclease/phosphatase, partial [Mycena haematopus]